MWQRLSVFCYHYTYWCHMTHERVCFTTTCTLCQLKYKSCNVCAAQLAGVIYCRPDVVSKFMLRWFRMPLREGNCTVTCTASVISLFLTRCVHCTAGCMNTPGCTTGWVNMQMSAAKRRLSGPARTLMTSLGWRAQQGGCVDSRRCGEFGRNLKKERILTYLFIFTLGSTWSCGKRTIGSITKSTKLYSTLFIQLLYEYSKRFVQPVVEPVVQPPVQPVVRCKPTFDVRIRDLQCPSSETSHTPGSTAFLYTLCGTL